MVDPPQPERIRDDLKGVIKGELLFDDLTRALYSTDASIFEVRPAGVVAPRDEDDVRALVRYAAEHQVPLVPRWPAADAPHGRLDDIVSSVVTLLEQNAALIQDGRPKTPFNRCGYLLHDVLGPKHLDLARLLVGSEGTLALFTEATLRTIPLPGGRALVLLGFDSLDTALRAA